MVLNVSDLWPESAVSMGMLHNRLVISLSTYLEEMLYLHSSLVTGQTKYIVSDIARRTGVYTALITNGVDLDTFIDPACIDRNARRAEFGLRDEFVVGYAGLHGFAQGLDIILDAAELLHGVPGIVFVLFGDGPEKPRLQEQAQQRGLNNLSFYSPQPKQTIATLMACFDACIVPLRGLDLFRGALPCKLLESMATGAPVIVSIAGEAEDLVRDANGGLCIPPDDARALANAILRLRDDPTLGQVLSQNARTYITRHYDRKEIAVKLNNLLLPLAEKGRQCAENPE
jgi:glycosyltransferase involved in cell wall biosynthesis